MLLDCVKERVAGAASEPLVVIFEGRPELVNQVFDTGLHKLKLILRVELLDKALQLAELASLNACLATEHIEREVLEVVHLHASRRLNEVAAQKDESLVHGDAAFIFRQFLPLLELRSPLRLQLLCLGHEVLRLGQAEKQFVRADIKLFYFVQVEVFFNQSADAF